MKNKKFFLLTISILFASIFAVKTAHAEGFTEISADINTETTWTKVNSPYIIKKAIKVNAPLTIEPGVVVKFSNVIFDNSTGSLYIQNSFSAVGTPTEKIVFTSACDSEYGANTLQYCSHKTYPMRGDWNGISVEPERKRLVSFEYVKILYGYNGLNYSTTNSFDAFAGYLSIKHSEISQNGGAGIFLRFTQPVMENLIISGNYDGILVYDASVDKMPKIKNSAIFDNVNGINGTAAGRTSNPIDARYNWWGDQSGPFYNYGGPVESNNLDGKGNRIIGSRVLFRSWAEQDPNIPKEPVIFVPGIGASINPDLMISGVFADNWKMFDHTYDGIIEMFRAMGYVEGQNFFIAYYDWRKSNTESAQDYLKPIVQKALANSKTGKVNVVTHSMGSLVARSFVQGDGYANEVNNLIMIAPPNRGSSDAYTAWEGGYVPKNWDGGWMMRAYLNYLKIKNNEFSAVEIVHKHIPSLKELMPVYDFIYTAGDSGNLKSYLSMNEKNEFLSKLNPGVEKLDQRTRFSVILGNKQPTVNKIPVVATDDLKVWADGKPSPIDPQYDDNGGDGEVLLTSGDVQSDFRDILEYGHREIVSKSEKIVADRLTHNLSGNYESPTIKDEMFVWSDAQADLTITAPDGKTISKNGSNINNSNYAEETKKDGFKIASVPNLQKGEYKIKLSGHTSGNAHLGMEYGDYTGAKKDVSSIKEVTVSSGKSEEFLVNIDPGNVEKPVGDIILKDTVKPVLVVISLKDGEEYQDNQILPITFSVSDNVTSVENMKIEMYLDNELFEGDSIDLSKLSLDEEHNFWINVIDEAGNTDNEDIYFRIRKADPPPVDDPPVDDDPVVVVDPPAKKPLVLPPVVAPSVIFTPSTPIFQSVQPQVSKKKSSKGHKKKSKKKKNKKSGKVSVVVVNQMRQVLGISASKNATKATVVSKLQNYVSAGPTTFWNKMSRAASELRNFVFNSLKNFKYFRR